MIEVVCFGEILWDVFPNRRVIGGAPLNVALRLHSFGARTKIVSSIGEDNLGDEVKEYLKQYNFPQDSIHLDPELPTGSVEVSLDESGSASYEIVKPVAWDRITLNEHIIETVESASVFLFGSLALRGRINRNTIASLLQKANYKVFDVNLRPPHYDISMVYELIQQSDFVKLNDEELDEVCKELGGPETDIKAQIQWLEKVTNTKSICVTRGGEGAILKYEDKFYEHPGFKVQVADTVGAGDSFLATLVYQLVLQKNDPDTSLSHACAVGALVASKEGANCEISEEEVLNFLKV
ncbi:MAG: carbohydrate kinase [Flavobacteriaceae bacterium]|nr:carbohydrate kinase [Flavobacteriaceae bacterium]